MRVGLVIALGSFVALQAAPLASQAARPTRSGHPLVLTGGVAHVRGTTGLLEGSVNPRGFVTTYFFQYGPTVAYGSQTATVTLAAGTTTVKVGQTASPLLPGYHYRLVASNQAGSKPGRDRVFAAHTIRDTFSIPKPTEATVFGSPLVLGGSPHRKMFISITLCWVREGPASYPLVNLGLVIAAGHNPRRGEYATIVVATRLWAMLVDGTFSIRQHGASSTRVVTHQYMALWQPGCRNQDFFAYTAKYSSLLRFDMDEVRRSATTDALSTSHIRSGFVKQCVTCLTKPGGKVTCRQVAIVVHSIQRTGVGCHSLPL